MAWKFFNYLVTDFCLGRRKHIGLTRPVSPVKGVMFTRTSGHQCSQRLYASQAETGNGRVSCKGRIVNAPARVCPRTPVGNGDAAPWPTRPPGRVPGRPWPTRPPGRVPRALPRCTKPIPGGCRWLNILGVTEVQRWGSHAFEMAGGRRRGCK